MSYKTFVVLLASFFLCIATLSAQTVTGSITGVIEDPHGAVMPSVDVKLTSETTGASRATTSSQNGEFTFNALPPDTYTLMVEHSGFKKYEKKNIELNASDHLSAGEIKLQIGQANESVEVLAEGAAVQTASTERSGVITSQQVQDLTVINRDFSVLASLQPGVVYTPGAEAQSFSSNSQFNVNGSRVGQNNITIDGVPIENSNGTNFNTFISMDAISEVKVQSSGYQAEFGRKAGGAVQAVTKSGGSEYHGEVYWYQRNNIFNALGSVAKTAHQIDPTKPIADPPYRFITAGANVGGPVYIPKIIPRDQKKLFFFFSEEQQRELRPQDVRQVTVPTALERAGNFSQSGANGTPLLIANPFDIKASGNLHKCTAATATAPAVTNGCFVNSIIPAAMIDPRTQGYLNLFPLPNVNGPNFNYQVQESLKIPKHTETLRVDFNPTPNNLFFVTMSRWWDDEQGFAVPAGNANFGWLPSEYNPIARFVALEGQHIFNPTLIFEAKFVASRWTEGNHPKAAVVATRSRPGTGINLPQLDPQNNPLQILPVASFGGVNNPANPSVSSRYPITGTENVFIFNPLLTKTWGTHTAKTGFYMEYWQEHKGVNGDFTGTYNFSSNSSSYTNILGNTGNPYANALIGDFQNYAENNTRPPLISHYNSYEWFAQDNWKAFRNLTLEMGVRLGWSRPFHNAPANEAGFVPERYDRSQQVLLYGMPGAPATPPGATGAEVPGNGNPVNGTVTNGIVPGFAQAFDPNYPPGMRNSGHVKVAPRLGFTYDPWSDGKTAIRGGFGIFYDLRERDNFFTNDFKSLPLQFSDNVEFGLSTASNTAAGPLTSSGIDYVNPSKVPAIFPSSSFAFQRNRKVPYVMQYNFGIQREVGFKTVVDIAYVGSQGRNLIWLLNMNALPVGSGSGASSNKFRPYLGYTDINQLQYSGTSNYNALQASVNRRFTKNFEFGIAYTWSRAFDFADTEGSTVLNTPFIFPTINFHQWQYGLAGYDRTHIFKASWTYDFPKASKLWDNGLVRGLLDDWRISGITTFQSGAPMSITLDNVCVLKGTALAGTVAVTPSSVCPSSVGSSNSATGFSGSTVGARVLILGTGNVTNVTTPYAHASGLDGFIFAPPIQNTLNNTQQGTPGFSPRNNFRGPGINNWDMSLFKQIPMPGERFHLQFRAEAYDVFNRTNWTTVDTNAQFQLDYLGHFAQVNPTFGKFTNAQLKRRMQLALKLSF